MTDLIKNLSRLTCVELELALIRYSLAPMDFPLKKDMVDAVAQGFEREPFTPLFTLGTDCVMLLHKMFQDGLTPTDDLVSTIPLLSEGMHLLRGFGLAWHTRGRWEVIPQTRELLLNITEDELSALRGHDALFAAIQGCLNLYGMLEVEELAQLLQKTTLPFANAGLVCNAYLSVCDPHQCVYVPQDEDLMFLCSLELEDPEWLWEELQHSQVPQARFEHNDYINAQYLPGDPDIYLPMEKWLRGEGATDAQIEQLCCNLAFNYMNDPDAPLSDLEEMMLEYARHGKTALTREERQLLIDLLEQVPLWTLRGHSMRSLHRQQSRKAAPRRDDLCPCGSGRKYRNCCGNFH